MSTNKGTNGRPWRRERAKVLAVSDICYICGKSGATSVDHVIPIDKGGPRLAPWNLRPCCISCNSRKGNRDKPKVQTSRRW